MVDSSPILTTDRLRPRLIAACLLAAAIAGLVYIRALHAPFVYDDLRLVDENRLIRDISDIRTVLLSNVSRPFIALSYAIDNHFWKQGPFGYHLTNLLLHVVNVVLVFLVGLRVSADRQRRFGAHGGAPAPGTVAFVAALLLAVHPACAEAVTYVAARADLLATGFVLLAFLAARRWLAGDRFPWLLGASLLWGCALLSKETAFIFPLVLAVYTRWIAPSTLRAVHPNGLRLLGITAVILVFARVALLLSIEYDDPLSWQWSLGLTQLDVVRQYLILIVAPHGQTIFHVVPAFAGWTDVRLWLSVVTLGGVAGWILLVRRRVPVAAWGLVWFLLALVPPAVLTLLDLGEPMAERRIYLPAVGAFLAAGALAGRTQALLARRGWWGRWAGRVALGFVALSLAGRTVERTEVWSSRVSVWAEAAMQAPNHWVPALALGESLHAEGRHAEAVAAFERSLAANDREPATYSKLGVCLIEIGRLDTASDAFVRLRTLLPRSAEASNGLATVALARGDLAGARAQYLATLESNPLNVESRRGLAQIARNEGDLAEARHRCDEIDLLQPLVPRTGVCAGLDAPENGAAGPVAQDQTAR